MKRDDRSGKAKRGFGANLAEWGVGKVQVKREEVDEDRLGDERWSEIGRKGL